MGISSYMYIHSITVADPGRGRNLTLWDIEVVQKWLIQLSRFHTQYENDKMGLCAYKERYTKQSCSFWLR